VFEKLLGRFPLPIMARMLLERALDPAHMDKLFEDAALVGAGIRRTHFRRVKTDPPPSRAGARNP